MCSNTLIYVMGRYIICFMNKGLEYIYSMHIVLVLCTCGHMRNAYLWSYEECIIMII